MSICSPHNDLNDFHGCIGQSIEEIHQNLSLFSHFSNDKSKDKAKDNQAEDIDAIWIHAYDLVFLCFILWIETKKTYWCVIIILLDSIDIEMLTRDLPVRVNNTLGNITKNTKKKTHLWMYHFFFLLPPPLAIKV